MPPIKSSTPIDKYRSPKSSVKVHPYQRKRSYFVKQPYQIPFGLLKLLSNFVTHVLINKVRAKGLVPCAAEYFARLNKYGRIYTGSEILFSEPADVETQVSIESKIESMLKETQKELRQGTLKINDFFSKHRYI